MVMLVVAFVSFSLFNFVGDPINNMVGEETSDEEISESVTCPDCGEVLSALTKPGALSKMRVHLKTHSA